MKQELLLQQVRALTQGVPHTIANLANTAAAIWQNMENINWAGFYLLQGDMLVLGPFQGKPACIEIPVGKGVCGAAAAQQKTQLVKNVHDFPGHIACDSASNSELVVPIFKNGKVWGVLDIDSPLIGRFSEEDARAMEALVQILEQTLAP
ncbi:MAG: GAF domain-containing protein [Oscillospiraceae bacterium]|nr:GAF domain-containing protein [Oscillospiraceae bacterium]